jgi:hypothetical protein
VGTSRFHRPAAYTRCLRCAGAPRRPASGSELLLHIPSWHAALSNPGKSDIDIFQNFDANIGLRRMTTGSALPTLPQSVPRGRSISWLHWFASATACQVACPPVRIRLGTSPATEDFYFQAFNVSVSLHVAGYNYNSDWTPCMGPFLSRSFGRAAHPLSFVGFFVRSGSPFLRPDPRFAHVDARRSCQGWPSRQPCNIPPFPGHTLTASSTTAPLVRSG